MFTVSLKTVLVTMKQQNYLFILSLFPACAICDGKSKFDFVESKQSNGFDIPRHHTLKLKSANSIKCFQEN